MKLKLAEKKIKRDQISALDAVTAKVPKLGLKHKLNGKEAEFRRVRNKHSDNFKRLFPIKTIESNIELDVQGLYDGLQGQIEQLNEPTHTAQATRLDRELIEYREKIYAAYHGSSVREGAVQVKGNGHPDKPEIRVASRRCSYVFRIEDDGCCLLCQKEMTGSDAKAINTELYEADQTLYDRLLAR
ncbi:hypothetical protein quinque_013936 [Culex quinquefasciatus]